MRNRQRSSHQSVGFQPALALALVGSLVAVEAVEAASGFGVGLIGEAFDALLRL